MSQSSGAVIMAKQMNGSASAPVKQSNGTFISMIRSDDALPFNERTAQRLMKIAEHPVLTNTTHESHLPTSWTTLYELSKASPALLEAKISTGTITPRLERSQVARKIFGKIPKAAQHTLDRVKQLRGELDAAQAYIAELEAARDAETAPPLTPGLGPETEPEPEPVNPEPVEAEVGQPQPEAERPIQTWSHMASASRSTSFVLITRCAGTRL